MSGPITPEEVKSGDNIPEVVFEIFNDLIRLNWDGYEAAINQNDIVDKIVQRLGITSNEVYAKHMLDVEEVYRDAGWNVEYDKPDYSEVRDCTFRFTK